MPISALLTQKPETDPPMQGDTRRFTLEQKPKREKPNETWTKAKNEGGDFGEPYNILKSERVDDYTHPQHGTFHQYSILLEPAQNGASQLDTNALAASDRDSRIARQVAFKGAVELVAVALSSIPSADQVVEQVGWYTDRLLPIVTGETDPKPAAATTDTIEDTTVQETTPKTVPDPEDLF